MDLIIVESPAKAKTINKYLGKNFVVKSSVGHVRDLPTGSSGKKVAAKSPAEVRKMAPEAKAKYKVFPSAYASGYIAKCRKRKGKIG